jgi:competence protein ComEC
MAILLIFAATMFGRPTFLPAILFGAAFFMTLLNPHILWDIGFQLSFVATLGLTLYLGPWSKSFRNLVQPVVGKRFANTSTRFVADVILATFAATIMTFPLMIYHFKTISLVNPLANLLILPAQPGIMTWGGLATLAGMISPILGQIPAWIAWLFLTYTIKLVEFFGSLPFATFQINMPVVGLIGGYAIIFAATAASRSGSDDEEESDNRWQIDGRVLRLSLVGLILVALLAGAWLWQRPDGKLHVAFLDVGQGDAILIQGPDGKQMLVDGGKRPSLLLSRVGEQMPFWDKSIDLVVATHPDADHVAGLVDLFENYAVGHVITNGTHEESGTGYFGLVSAAQKANTPILGLSGGEVIEFGPDVQIEILHTGDLPVSDNDNDESIVMRLVYDDFSLLLTGDAGHTAEEALLKSGKNVQSAVLKAGHHGSNTASGREFLQAVNPQIVIICGGGERYDHPHAQVLERIEEIGSAVWRTDELGTIELISDGKLISSNVSDGIAGES